MRVLVVDDSTTMRNIIKRGLGMLDVSDISEARDGMEGLTAFESGEFDLVLSDWNMPNMDGLEFLKEVRKLNAAVPFVMITTQGDRSCVISAIQAGVSDYLVKPISIDSFKDTLEQWISVGT